MRLPLAVLCLTVLLTSVVGCLGTQRRAWGVALLVASAAWLPLNNAEIEGPVLIALSRTHGFTVADAVGVAGAALAGLIIWPPDRWRSLRWVLVRVAVVAVVIALGFTLAFADTDERIDQQQHYERNRPGPDARLPGLDNGFAQTTHRFGTALRVTVEA